MSLWEQLREAIKSGQTDKALKLTEQCMELSHRQPISSVSFAGMALNHLTSFGEEELEKLFRLRYSAPAAEWIATTPGAKESVERFASGMENPYSNITITEEADRYMLTLDPCRTGGRLRKGIFVGPKSIKLAGVSIGTTSKAYPWSWGKKGVSYYCLHECFFMEIIPIELRGYPIAVVQYAERSEDPCVLLFYKKPEQIPDEYFLRVGKTPWRLRPGRHE
ncbi:hypothetical protein ACFLVN_01850 [Chloroflexota bacterium]